MSRSIKVLNMQELQAGKPWLYSTEELGSSYQKSHKENVPSLKPSLFSTFKAICLIDWCVHRRKQNVFAEEKERTSPRYCNWLKLKYFYYFYLLFFIYFLPLELMWPAYPTACSWGNMISCMLCNSTLSLISLFHLYTALPQNLWDRGMDIVPTFVHVYFTSFLCFKVLNEKR